MIKFQFVEVLERKARASPVQGWCAAQRIEIAVIAGGNHT